MKDERRINLLDCLVLAVLLGSGLGVGWGAFQRYGWPGLVLGLLIGPLVIVGLLHVIGLGLDWLQWGWLPRCAGGHGGGRLRYQGGHWLVPPPEGSVVRCRECGHEYVKAGRRFMRRLPDGTVEPYLIWKLFRGYVPDAGPP